MKDRERERKPEYWVERKRLGILAGLREKERTIVFNRKKERYREKGHEC